MASEFEELDFQRTPVGELCLRRRRSPAVPDRLVYEVRLDDGMLMSSAVTAGEEALARLTLAGREGRRARVLIGGLGLGSTAAAALECADVERLVVVELLGAVIAWHRNRLVPLAERLVTDPRCEFLAGDFFRLMSDDAPVPPEGRFDAILLDIDHAPDSWLHPGHATFYQAAGLRGLMRRLAPGGVFGLWSAAEPPPAFLDMLAGLFARVQTHPVTFTNPHLGRPDTNWIVVAEASA